MTKLRPVGTLEEAIARIRGLIGDRACAVAVGKSEALIQKWSDADKDAQPNLRQALALDRAYLAAGHAEPPILNWLALQLEVARGAEQRPLPDQMLMLGAEVGQAQRALAEALGDGRLSANEKSRMARELDDVAERVKAMRVTLATTSSDPMIGRAPPVSLVGPHPAAKAAG